MMLAKNSLFVFSSLQAHLRLEVFPYVKYTLSITERRTRGPMSCPIHNRNHSHTQFHIECPKSISQVKVAIMLYVS